MTNKNYSIHRKVWYDEILSLLAIFSLFYQKSSQVYAGNFIAAKHQKNEQVA